MGSVTFATAAQAQSSPSDYTSATRYDIKGQVTGTIAPDPDGSGALKYLATRNTYDIRGNVTKVETGELSSWKAETIAPASWTGFTIHRTVHSTYDLMNRKTKTWLVAGGVTQTLTQYSYDDLGRVVCTAVRMTNFPAAASFPDPCTQNGTAGANGKDRITKNVYGITNQIAQIRRAVGTNIEQAEVTYSYTPNRKISAVIDANGNRAQMVYDGHDRLKRWRFPSPVRASAYDDSTQASALSTAGIASDIDYEEYGYDLNGNRTSLRKRDGQVISYSYDALNRMTAKDIPGTTAIDVNYSYDNRGLQLSALFASPATGITTSYDNAGRVLTSANNMSGTARTLSYQYDQNSNRTKITHPDGQEFDYTYDILNRQLGIEEETSSTTLHSSVYNNQGQLTTATRLTGVESAYQYDPAGRVNNIALALAGTVHDNAFTFTYTPASQISIRTTSNDRYAHSAHFNVDRNYQSNGLNQYYQVGDYAVTYDDNGNLTSDGGVSFTYDTENRLTSASGAKTAQLIYDPLGRLYETNDGAGGGVTRFLYDGDALVAEYNASGAITARYVHGNGVDQPVVWYEGNSVSSTTRRHLFANWQGSITAITDASGNAIAVNAYDSWGIPNPDNIGRFQYTGQIWLPQLGLYHYKARAYSPFFGRFLQTDPVGYDGGMGLYVYANNDPINLLDALGLAPGDVFETPLEAAEDATASINATSIAQNQEYIGTVERIIVDENVRVDVGGNTVINETTQRDVYVASQPVSGTATTAQADPVKASDLAGQYHTHGDYSYTDNSGNVQRVPQTDPNRAQSDTFNSDNFSSSGPGNDVSVANTNAAATSQYRNEWGQPYVSVLGTPSGSIINIQVP